VQAGTCLVGGVHVLAGFRHLEHLLPQGACLGALAGRVQRGGELKGGNITTATASTTTTTQPTCSLKAGFQLRL